MAIKVGINGFGRIGLLVFVQPLHNRKSLKLWVLMTRLSIRLYGIHGKI